MALPKIDTSYLTDFLVKLLNIPSPTGFSDPAIDFVESELSAYKQLQLSRTHPDSLVATTNWIVCIC
jgi:putative aminopeptidase FrvX